MTASDSGELLISGGGVSAVATDELFAVAQRLEQLHARASEERARLSALALVLDDQLGQLAPGAGAAAVDAAGELDAVASSAGHLALALRLSAEAYGAAESRIMMASTMSAALLGNTLGHLAPFLLVAAAPLLAGTAVAALAALALVPGGPKSLADVERWMRDNPQLVNNPVVAAAVRLLFSSSDDVVGGLLGVPPAVAGLIGDEGLGLFGIREAVGIVLATAAGAGALTGGVLVETPVKTTAVSGGPVSAPTSLRDLGERMPRAGGEAPRIRVERYPSENGENSWIVYFGGTIDSGIQPNLEAFDMTSNLGSMSGGDAASYRAAVEALAQAGVDQGDPIFEVGYSQGGLLAVQLEQSGDYNVRGIVTLGSPVGQFETGAPTLTVAHAEDIVPALGGVDSARGDDRVLVRRSIYDDAPVPRGDALPAHALDNYAETLGLIDASSERRLVEFRQGAAGFFNPTAEGTAIEFRAERVR